MSIFSKIGEGLKNASKWVGKNAVKVAAIAAPVAALAIPGVGGAVSGFLGNVLGKGKESDPLAGLSSATAAGVADHPDGSGGLFGKGGLFGTGLLASREWTQYNKTMKWAKQDQKVLDKAQKILGFAPQNLDAVMQFLGVEKTEQLKAEAAEELLNAGEKPPVPGAPKKDEGVSTAVKIGGAALLAKLLGFI